MPATAPASFHAFKTTTLEGQPADLSQYKGQVVLVVNTASECGLTPQYKGLEALHEQLAGRGFAVLGFPSNDFGGQEPGTPAQIRDFCSSTYGVKFPLFAKVQTKEGPGQSPVYAWLKEQTGQLPRWNFGKYLVGKDGQLIAVRLNGSLYEGEDGEKLRDRVLRASPEIVDFVRKFVEEARK